VTHPTTRARARAAIWIRRVKITLTLTIWALAFWASWENLSQAALIAFPRPVSYALPCVVDLFILVAGLDVLRSTLERRSTVFGWAATTLAVATSTAFNLLHATSPVQAAWMAIAPIAQACAWEVVMRSIRSTLTPVTVPPRATKTRAAAAADATEVQTAPEIAPGAPQTAASPRPVPSTPPAPRPAPVAAVATTTSGDKAAAIEQVIDRWEAEGRDVFARGVAPRIAAEVGATETYVRGILKDLKAQRDAGDAAPVPAAA
jgi:hypothetical protein